MNSSWRRQLSKTDKKQNTTFQNIHIVCQSLQKYIVGSHRILATQSTQFIIFLNDCKSHSLKNWIKRKAICQKNHQDEMAKTKSSFCWRPNFSNSQNDATWESWRYLVCLVYRNNITLFLLKLSLICLFVFRRNSTPFYFSETIPPQSVKGNDCKMKQEWWHCKESKK